MADDYISTTPWNDPFNPFPIANSVYLSAVNISPRILTVSNIDPTQLYVPGASVVRYQVAGSFISISLNYFYVEAVGAHTWGITPALGLTFDYGLITETRQVPTKLPGLSGNWYARNGVSTPEQIASLAVLPNFNDVTPWEKRRKRLLEIV